MQNQSRKFYVQKGVTAYQILQGLERLAVPAETPPHEEFFPAAPAGQPSLRVLLSLLLIVLWKGLHLQRGLLVESQ